MTFTFSIMIRNVLAGVLSECKVLNFMSIWLFLWFQEREEAEAMLGIEGEKIKEEESDSNAAPARSGRSQSSKGRSKDRERVSSVRDELWNWLNLWQEPPRSPISLWTFAIHSRSIPGAVRVWVNCFLYIRVGWAPPGIWHWSHNSLFVLFFYWINKK